MSEEYTKEGTMSGSLSGTIRGTDGSVIEATEITLKLDRALTWALCNVLCRFDESCLENSQVEGIRNLGKALGAIVEHPISKQGRLSKALDPELAEGIRKHREDLVRNATFTK